jgi:4'-phosphopantetheinyl transferase
MNITDANFSVDSRLALPEDEVQLWRADLATIGSNESRWQSLLSADEKQRASRFHFAIDRQRFATTRALLRLLLAGYLSARPNDLTFSYSEKEKPSLRTSYAEGNVAFNVSHSGEIALLAFTRGRRIGVDVEHIHRDIEVDSIARRFFSAREQMELAAMADEERVHSFFRCWTRKEAYIKAVGDGLSLPLSQFDVSLEPGAKTALLATRPDNSEAERWLLRETPAGDNYAAALCVEGRDWKLRDWTTASSF